MSRGETALRVLACAACECHAKITRSAIDAIDHATGVYFPRRSHAARIAIKKLRYATEIAQATRVADRGGALRELKKGQDLLGDLHDRQTLIDQLDQDMLLGHHPGADRDLQVVKQVLEAECRQLHSQYLARRTGLLAACRTGQRGSLRNHQPVGSLVAAGAVAASAAIYLAYLEHARIYCFLNGGEEEVYLASADWMTRNLDKRIELMFPVEQAEHKAKVISTLRSMFRDTVKSRWLGADGVYRRRPLAHGEAPFRVQEHLQEEARRLASLARDRAGISFQPEERTNPPSRRTRE